MKPQSLKFRFTATVAVVYIIIGIVTYGTFHMVTGRLVRSLGTRFAIKQALL